MLKNIGEIMKYAKVPTSDSYHSFKISNLKNPNYSAAYLSLIFGEEEEGDLEMGIMLSAMRDVFEALGEPNMSAEDGNLHLEKLDALLSPEGSATIYGLAHWLNALGLKLTVAVDAGEKREEEDFAGGAELAEFGNI
ncbi:MULTISPECIES: helix-turn-helix domain-containing transcriptional regulator [unclassified Microcoleus]|uniref:helix-turn-helix domain-containing transcriptional regulator n=1 Tax=unclassified Microcoleus TaxID=2642155 RepID=UPI002FD2F130